MPNDDSMIRFAADHHGVFAILCFDVDPPEHHHRQRRLNSGRWVELYPGVYRIAGAPVTWSGDLLAACWAGGPKAVASHRASGALWALPGGREVVEITCPRWRRTQKSSRNG